MQNSKEKITTLELLFRLRQKVGNALLSIQNRLFDIKISATYY